MKRILFVSIAFPPKNDPECLQAGRYAKYMLRNNDACIDVVTSSVPTLHMPYDASLESVNFSRLSKIEIPILETKITNFLLRKLFRPGISFPDSKFTFYMQWRKVVRHIASPPDVIYSRSNPVSSALMAFKLQQHFSVPWLMHLSDPWVGSSFSSYSRKERQFNQYWERSCFRAAARVSFTTQKTLEFYTLRYPEFAGKFMVSPNVFDPDTISREPVNLTGRMRIVYTGGLAGKRTARFFLEACRQVWKKYPLFGETDVIFAGPTDRENRKIFQEFSLPFVKHVGSIPYQQARSLQQDAHVLLAIDQPQDHPLDAMFFPSKILDYFSARRKILALTDHDSSTARILASCNSAVITYPDLDSLKDFLVQAMNAFRKRDISFFEAQKFPSDFSAPENTVKLMSLLKSL